MSRRLTALVIGNADYADAGKLKNPVNDAGDISAKLAECGFTVDTRLDCSHQEMEEALRDFKKALRDSDVGLFFFAGHGMQIDGHNYLAAIDTDVEGEIEAKHSSLPLNQIIEIMEKADNASSIIILDACRNNPFERAWARSMSSRGLAPVYAPRGTLVAYATSPGQLAADGRGRRNGAYTAALLQHLATPDCSIENMFKRVRNTLNTATGGKQISWEHTSLAGDFFFNMSLGARIDEYADTALRDSLFVIDDKKASHRVIKALKTLDWYRQNPAIEEFTSAVAGRASPDSLFVVGRNIYQAACGGSNGANTYLTDFTSRAAGLKPERRKALLDGMLFEVFFDPDARLRKEFKMRKFQELFHLQQHAQLKSSFDFIAECLLPEVGRFYSIPGKGHAVVVDVVTKAGAKPGSQVLKSVHIGGDNILWMEDADYAPEPGEAPMLEKLSLAKFEDRLAEQMVVPAEFLTINYASFSKTLAEQVYFPYGWTTRKR
ncbi:caspase family protein [Acidovorax radicis]|uniref:caspase family protein n=1 Tax=Acidovorax radicis TaxID=758826 RepID=UPI001CFA6524|nr:caspase family protein [Acidovorax radicis]UCU99626.1 caspase family protein [Acidovorax radicis]